MVLCSFVLLSLCVCMCVYLYIYVKVQVYLCTHVWRLGDSRMVHVYGVYGPAKLRLFCLLISGGSHLLSPTACCP